jgi:hypothetical protein
MKNMKIILLTLIIGSFTLPVMGMQMDTQEKSSGIPFCAKLVLTIGTLPVDAILAPSVTCIRMGLCQQPPTREEAICCSQTAKLWECDESETCRTILSCGLPSYKMD